MTTYERTLVTSALPYANGPIHIGHLAGAYLPSDLFVRYKRLVGEDIVHICGSDELGVAIMIRARQEGTTPQEIVDHYHPMIADALNRFGVSFDYYGRTTSEVHRETSQAFFNTLAEKGVFVTRTERQPFDPHEGMFLADRFVVGTCPNCGNERAHGDQCEVCGTSLSPSELLNPRSALSDSALEWRETVHWYLPLGDMQPEIESFIQERKNWKVNVVGQVGSWLKEGLRDRAITRDVPWGVPVPQKAAALADVDATGKVIYVWFDAPIGYISATREWATSTGDSDRWKEYWQDPTTRLIHFIGKDNIVFHCIMFPAMLMAHGGYVLPADVPANEFLNIEGQKLSTSRGWAVWLHEYLEELPADLLRYALASTLPETKDADFSWVEFQARVNNELADVLGNFANRTITFANRYFGGKVPELVSPSAAHSEALAALAEYRDLIGTAYESFRNREAAFQTIALARLGNKFFNDTEPWRLVKDAPSEAGSAIHVALQILASLSILMDPLLPFAARDLRKMLNMPAVVDSGATSGSSGGLGWEDAGLPLLQTGQTLGEPVILFNKIEDEVVARWMERLGNGSTSTASEALEPRKEEIDFEVFERLDLRAGTILTAERVPKADKLLRLEVDLGFETRQIISGIAQHFDAGDLVGRRVVVVANLRPRKLRGLLSAGMLLTSEEPDGTLHLITPGGPDGSVIR